MKINTEKYQMGVRAILIFAFAIVFVTACVQQSGLKGRLCSVPNYDDVVYMYQGALLQKLVADQGISGFQKYLEVGDFHSPFSILLASLSFAISGNRDEAPYIGNLVVVIGFLAGLAWLLRRLKFFDWLLCTVMFLTLPFITMGVVEFRPDIAWSVITGFGVVWIVTEPDVVSNYTKSALSGLFLGLSLVVKPTTFPMTALLYSGAIFSRAAICYWTREKIPPLVRLFKCAVVVLIVTGLVAGPYWVRYGRGIWDYFFLNSFGANKAVWTIAMGQRDSIMYYISGGGGASIIGKSGVFVFIFSFLCGSFAFFWKRNSRLTISFLLLIILGAWGVNSVAAMKTPFLGGGFYGVMIFFSAYLIALAYKAENLKTWIKVIFRVALCLFCVSSIISYAWPEYSDYFKSQKDSLANLHDSNEFFVRNLQKCREDIPKQILSTQAGPIIMEGIQLSMMRSNPNIAIRWHMGAFIRTADAFRYTYPIFDWVLLQDPGMKGSSPNMPSEAVLPEFRAVISADQNYKVHAEYVDPDGKRITIYSRTGRNQTAE